MHFDVGKTEALSQLWK